MPEECTLDKLEEFLTYQVAAIPAAVIMAEQLDTACIWLARPKTLLLAIAGFRTLVLLWKAYLSYSTATQTVSAYSVLSQKNKTVYRANMSTKTLGSLITRKTMMSVMSKPCHSVEHSQELLKRAKSATYVHLHERSSTSAPVTSTSK